jgi:hypothetical protein
LNQRLKVAMWTLSFGHHGFSTSYTRDNFGPSITA